MKRLLALATSLLLTSNSVGQATDFVWDGELNAGWTSSTSIPLGMVGTQFFTNWTPDRGLSLELPGLGDAVFFLNPSSNTTVTLDGTRVVDTINFGGTTNYALTVGGLGLSTGSLNATGSATHTLDVAVGLLAAGAWDIDQAATIIASGVIDDAGGAVTLEKLGTGTLVFEANNTHAGTSILGGTLVLSSGNQIGVTGADLTLADGTTLRAAASFTAGSGRGLSLTSGIAMLDLDGNDLGWDGVISGSGGLVLDGGAAFSPTANNSHSGFQVMNGTTLAISNLNQLGADGADVTLDGGTLMVNSNVGGAASRTLIVNTQSTVDTGSNSVNWQGTTSGAGDLTITDAGAFTFSGTGPNLLSGAVVFESSGTLNLNKTAGVVAIAGDLMLNDGQTNQLADNQIADASIVTVNNGTYDLNGFTETINTLSNSGGDTLLNGGTLNATTLAVSAGTVNLGGGVLNTGAFSMSSGAVDLVGGVLTTDNTVFITGGELKLLTAGDLFNATQPAPGANGLNGGNGSNGLTLNQSGGAITVTDGEFRFRGAAGGAGLFDFFNGGNGGSGGTGGSILLAGTNQFSGLATLNLRGGNGGKGGDSADLGGAGGDGGNGGQGGVGGALTIVGGNTTIGGASTVDLRGGNGGTRGSAHINGVAGSGGAGGTLSQSAGTLTLNGGTIDLSGGTGASRGVSGSVHLTGGSLVLSAGLITGRSDLTPATDDVVLHRATIDADTASTVTVSGSLTIDNGTLDIGGNALDLPDNAAITVANDGQLLHSLLLDVDNGASLTVNSGGEVTVDDRLFVGVQGIGTLTVDGVGAAVTAVTNPSRNVWGNEGTANVTFSNGATGSLGLTRVGADGRGFVDVLTGATLSFTQLDLGIVSLNGTQGELTVDGVGSTLEVTGTTTVGATVGSGSSALLTIQNSGRMQSQSLTVRQRGALDVNTGGLIDATPDAQTTLAAIGVDGYAFTTSTQVSVDSAEVRFNGGQGGPADGTNAFSAGAGGAAGSWIHTLGAATLNGVAVVSLTGGAGGDVMHEENGGRGGVGGVAEISGGTLTLGGASLLKLEGGRGGQRLPVPPRTEDAVEGGDGGLGGQLLVSGGTVNLTGGTVSVSGGMGGNGSASNGARGAAGLVNVTSGTLNLSAGLITGRSDQTPTSADPITLYQADLNASGGDVVANAALSIEGNLAEINLSAGSLTATTIRQVASGELVFTGGTLAFDTFDGDLVQDGGALLVGGAADTQVDLVLGDFNLNVGVLAVELAGAGDIPGADFDQVNVSGTATIDPAAVLDVSLLSAFAPSLGDSFNVLSASGGVNGVFGSLIGSPGGGLEYELLYDANDVFLVVSSGLDGDYSNDGVVSAADYTVWRDNLNASAGTLLNDADGGAIGAAQYGTWHANYGATLTPPSPLTGARVPEPNTCVLLMLFTLARAYRYRNR